MFHKNEVKMLEKLRYRQKYISYVMIFMLGGLWEVCPLFIREVHPLIIDSHAHYNNNAYKKPFRYLTWNEDGYTLAEGDREQLFQELLDANIPYCIEPGVGSVFAFMPPT